MMKNKKLKLDELKVKSFVTNEDDNNALTIKGGTGTSVIDKTDPFGSQFPMCGPTPATHCFYCPGDFTNPQDEIR